MRLTFCILPVLSFLASSQCGHADSSLSPLSDAEADAIIAQQVAGKAQAEAEHIANSVAFTVLERREVDMGGRKLISNRVSDPKLPKLKVKTSTAAPADYVIPPEFLEYAAREHVTLMLSATVYNREVTHLKWRHEEIEYEAWSSIDWNFMRGVNNLKSETKDFMIFQGVGDSYYDVNELPALPEFTPNQAEYFVFADSTSEIDDAAFEAVDILHSYYDANEAELKNRYQRYEALSAAKKRHDAAHPKKPKNAVVHFWKSEDDN